jgi:WD40 repeat protein
MQHAEAIEPVADPFQGHEDRITSVAFSCDGKRIVSGSRDNTVCVGNAETGEFITQSFQGSKLRVADHVMVIASRNQIIAASRLVCCQDFQTGKKHHILHSCQHAPFIAFSSRCEHALCWDTGQEDLDWSPRDVKFDQQSGWILGPHNELILWIPPHHRHGLHLPRTITNCGVKPTELDLSQFVHGHSWVKCYTPIS